MTDPREFTGKSPNAYRTLVLGRLLLLAIVVLAVAALFGRYHAGSWKVTLAVLGFGAVVLFHEVGHFVAAKACGIQVDAFSIFWLPTRVCSSSWASL